MFNWPADVKSLSGSAPKIALSRRLRRRSIWARFPQAWSGFRFAWTACTPQSITVTDQSGRVTGIVTGDDSGGFL